MPKSVFAYRFRDRRLNPPSDLPAFANLGLSQSFSDRPDYRINQAANPFNGHLDPIAGPQKDRWLTGKADPRRRAADNDRTGIQGGYL